MSDVDDVRALCRLMVRYGVTKLQVRGVTLERPEAIVRAEAAPAKTDEDEDEKPGGDIFDEGALERRMHEIAQMTPDAADRALSLAPLPRVT